MNPIYKICEHTNKLDQKRYTIKYLDWYFPIWFTITKPVTYEFSETSYYATYEAAYDAVLAMKKQDEMNRLKTYKTKKCTIIK